MHRPTFVLAAFLCFLLAGASRATAQDRGELIRQAEEFYQNFQTEPALNNLRAALGPTRGQLDSIWAHGVHLLAQIYYEQGDTAQASTWLRWAFRADPTIRVDRAKFLPEVLALSEAARTWSRRVDSEGDFVTDTKFEWPVGRMVPQTGSLRIDNAGLGVPLRVLVQRTGDPQGRPVPEGVTATLAPGTYEVKAAADGFLGVRITRVVLPGVTTGRSRWRRRLSASLHPSRGSASAPRRRWSCTADFAWRRSPRCCSSTGEKTWWSAGKEAFRRTSGSSWGSWSGSSRRGMRRPASSWSGDVPWPAPETWREPIAPYVAAILVSRTTPPEALAGARELETMLVDRVETEIIVLLAEEGMVPDPELAAKLSRIRSATQHPGLQAAVDREVLRLTRGTLGPR